MHAAVSQLPVMQVGFFRSLTGQFRHAGYGFPLLFAFLYLLQENVGHIEVFMQEIIHIFLDEVANELIDAHAR